MKLLLSLFCLLCLTSISGRGQDDQARLYFLKAASDGDVKIVEELLKKGVPIESQTKKEGYTALMLATAEGRTNVMQFLINSGAKLNAIAKRRETALHLAALHCQKASAELLLTNKAEIKLTDSGLTPLMLAASSSCTDLVKLFLANGDKVNARQYDGWTPLMHAATKDDTNIVTILLDHGANLTARSQKYETALHVAERYKHKKVIALLKNAAQQKEK